MCATFEAGGDYTAEELSDIRAALDGSTARVKASVEARHAKFRELEEARAEARRALDQFQESYQECLKELSMSKGIGQKCV